jgi:hypothetical protein
VRYKLIALVVLLLSCSPFRSPEDVVKEDGSPVVKVTEHFPLTYYIDTAYRRCFVTIWHHDGISEIKCPAELLQ